jgi:hypothetical protein
MLRNPVLATVSSTCYLTIYVILLSVEKYWDIAFSMFLFSPVVVIWLVYTIVRYGKYTGKELEAGQEYGYEDR